MTLTDILIDLVCTNEPISAGALTSRVINHPQWKEKTRSGTYWNVKDELEKLVEEGLLFSTEVKMTRKYHS